MRQCKFCGTFNDPSLQECTTCETSLDASVQSYGQQGQQLHVGDNSGLDHTLNTQPSAPSAQYHQGYQQSVGPYQAAAAQSPGQTAQFGSIAGDAGHASHHQSSPHNNTDNYNLPPHLSSPPQHTIPSTPSAKAAASQVAAQGAMVNAGPPVSYNAAGSSPAMDAFESAPDQAPPEQPENPYQVDFGGFSGAPAPGMSGKLRTLMVFLGLACAGILVFFVYLFFADPSDGEKDMAAKRKGPDLTSPAGKTKHLLKLATVDIEQQRWSSAKENIDQALSMAPNQDLSSQAQALKGRLQKEKHASDWFAQALKYDKKGDFGSAYVSLQKVDSSTKLYAKAQLLLKRIKTQRLPAAAQQASRYARRKRTFKKAYLTLLQIERVAPKYKGLRRAKRKLKRKYKRYLRKRKSKCRRYCRRRYRRRRYRKKRSGCYERCSKKYALPELKPISIKPPASVQAASRVPPPIPRKAACCEKQTKRLSRCMSHCYRWRRRWCFRRARRKYRRSRRRRNRYIRRYCSKKKVLRYCRVSRSRRACRGSSRSLTRCKRRCK